MVINLVTSIFLSSLIFIHMFDLETKFVIPTHGGLEDVLAKELKQLGARDVQSNWRSVSCIGDAGFMYKANFCLRTGLFVFAQISEFALSHQDDLPKNLELIDWNKYLNTGQSFNVKCTSTSELFDNPLSVIDSTKKIISSFFLTKFNYSIVESDIHPDVEIHISLNSKCEVLLNSTGESLASRGYKVSCQHESLDASMAAGLVMLSGWESHQPLIDFMCDTGTIPIEAALWAARIPPGAFRKQYSFEKWNGFDLELFNTIRDKQIERILNNPIRVFANDNDQYKIEIAIQNISNAGVEDMITVTNIDFKNFDRPERNGVILINPPFGSNDDESNDFFKSIGDCFKQRYAGYKAYIFTSNPETGKSIGLKAKQRIKLFQGNAECRLLGYELFEGSR